MSLDPALREAYESITTATITTILLKKGLRNVWLRGTRPLRSGQGRQEQKDEDEAHRGEKDGRPTACPGLSGTDHRRPLFF